MTKVERWEAALDLAVKLSIMTAEKQVLMGKLVASIRNELRLARQERALIENGGSPQESES